MVLSSILYLQEQEKYCKYLTKYNDFTTLFDLVKTRNLIFNIDNSSYLLFRLFILISFNVFRRDSFLPNILEINK